MTEDMVTEPHETVQEAGEHGGHGGHGGHDAPRTPGKIMVRIAAIMMIVFAVFLAIFNGQSSDHETHSVISRMEANDKWTQFGVATIKGSVWEAVDFMLETLQGPPKVDTDATIKKVEEALGQPLTADQKAKVLAVIVETATVASNEKFEAAHHKASDQVKKYEAKKGELERAADTLEEHSKTHLLNHEKFKKALNILQIGLALTAGVMLVASFWVLCTLFFASGVGLGALAIFLGAIGYGWIEVPHALAPYLIKLGVG